MKTGHALFSSVQLLMIIALFCGGAACLGFHYSPLARQKCAEWIIYPNTSFLVLGSVTLGTALLLTISFFYMQRGRYLRIQMGGKEFFIAEEALRKMIEEFWKKKYPHQSPPTDVFISQQKIEIVSHELDSDLEKIEIQLAKFLSKQVGYKREFFVTLKSRS